jgi:hypothetical protein
LGYKGLHAVDLETLDSQLLSPQDQQGFTLLSNSVENPTEFKANAGLNLAIFKSDTLLSARFFAPKIVDFNAVPDTASGHDPYKAGWRKLVRLNALAKSDAYSKGNIASAYLLFNFFSDNPKDNPFPVKTPDSKTQSVNNQVILVPRSFKKGVEDSVYFLDYQPFGVDRYKVGKALHAAFDTLDPSKGDTKQDYFVPTACSQCHGHDQERGEANSQGNYSFGKVNYLDTDQWYDMMNFDFPNTKAQHDVVFDGNDPGHASTKYKVAVGTFLKLNSEIVRQNETALRANGSDDFKVLAAKKWISLHPKGEGPVEPLRRAIGKSAWASGDLPLLQMLDRYCFRCHSSMYYDIFDRAAVLKEKGTPQAPGPLLAYVASGFMPQGRKLAQSEKDTLVGYLKALK